MYRNILLILLTAVLLFSCRTTDEPLPEDASADQAVETEPAESAVEETAVIEVSELAEDSSAVSAQESGELSEAPGKELNRSGGVKTADSEALLEEAVDPELKEADAGPVDLDEPDMAVEELPRPAEEPAAEEAVIDEQIADEPVIDEPEADVQPADVTTAEIDPVPDEAEDLSDSDSESVETTGAAPVIVLENPSEARTELSTADTGESLPSEYDSTPSNPLLPVVIHGGEDSEPEEEVQKEAVQETPQQAAQDEPVPVRAAPPASRPMEREEYSLSRDPSGKLLVTLDGSGWVFLSGGENSAYSLYEKYYDPETERTIFSFRVDGRKEYDSELQFMKQDILMGESEDRVLPMDEDLFLSLESGEKAPEEESPEIEDSTVAAETAISDLLKEEPAELQADIYDDPFLGILESAEPFEEPEEPVMEEAAPVVYTEEDLVNMSASELYELARSYETPGRDQSLEKARELYLRIRNTYPVTEERFLAEDRIRYLDRYYFKVQ
ncbi:MAG: hypothetical protein PQJ50_07105 [Spirochaetales bacterium]|nr:hypothetical protein [Spirochaetales bacterium]